MPSDQHATSRSEVKSESHSASEIDGPSPSQPAKFWLPWGIGMLFLLAAFWWLAGPRDRVRNDGPGVGSPAPAVDLVRLAPEDSYPAITGVTPGKVTLLHLWGTWCGPCRMEYPHLDEMVSEVQAQGPLEFLSVSCESGAESLEGLTQKTHEYLESISADTTAYADPEGVTRLSVAKRLNQSTVFFPTSVLIDAEGPIRGVWQGYAPDSVDEIRDAIKELWEKQPRMTSPQA